MDATTQDFTQLTVTEHGDQLVIWQVAKRMLDEPIIHDFGKELFDIVDHDDHEVFILSFEGVESFQSIALGKLIAADAKVKAAGKKLVLCSIRKEILYDFYVTRLTQLFPIATNESAALQSQLMSQAEFAQMFDTQKS